MLANFGQNDRRLREYGFEPVGGSLFPTYGVRAQFWTESGWRIGGSMRYGFARSEGPRSEVPTTTSFVTMAYSAGYRLGAGFTLGGDVGFGVLSHSVGSRDQGGALTYIGPLVHPRIAWTPKLGSFFIEPSVGYLLQIPLGPAHDNPLWEASFDRPFVHALTFSLDLGGHL